MRRREARSSCCRMQCAPRGLSAYRGSGKGGPLFFDGSEIFLHKVSFLRDGKGMAGERWLCVPGLWNNNMTTALRMPSFRIVIRNVGYVVVQRV